MAIKHIVRSSKADGSSREVTLTPLRAIRLRCLDCVCYSANEVKLCVDKHCSLYPYRLGHDPVREGLGNPDAFKKSIEPCCESEEKALISTF